MRIKVITRLCQFAETPLRELESLAVEKLIKIIENSRKNVSSRLKVT